MCSVSRRLGSSGTVMLYTYKRSYVGWDLTSKVGLDSYLAFGALLGIYDFIGNEETTNQNIIRFGIPKHPLLMKFENSLFEFNKKEENKIQASSIPPLKQKGGNPTITNINQIQLLRKVTRVSDVDIRLGWVDIWKNHFRENYNVFVNVIKMNSSIVQGEEGGGNDVYYLFYREQLHKGLVSAYICNGMFDTLYRSFIQHMALKRQLSDDSQIETFSFDSKLPYISEHVKLEYAYPMLFDVNGESTITSSFFNTKNSVSIDIINALFKKYDQD